MKFYISTAFLTEEIVEVARAADELGYDGIGIPDHVVNLETLATPYPYTRDGQRRWQPFTDWPDPWVLVGALEGWYGINEENQEHGAGLTKRMQKVLGSQWNPTDALLQWTMSEAADDLPSNKTYQNLTKRAPFSPTGSA